MSTESEHIASVVEEADRWLESHRVSENWRTMNRLRDTLVRTASRGTLENENSQIGWGKS